MTDDKTHPSPDDATKTQEACRKSNDRFQSLASTIPGHIAYVNATTLHYEYVNDAFEKSFGIPVNQIIGSHIRDIIGENNYQFALKYINIVKSGQSVSYENIFNLVSGQRWIQVNYSPYFDSSGQVESIVVLSYDITVRKQAEEALRESEERFRSIVMNTAAGYFFLDTQCIIRNVNEAWLTLYKYHSPDEVVGQHFTVVQKIEDIEQAKQLVEEIMKGNPAYLTGEFSRKCKDDSIGYHTFSARPVIHSGKVVGVEGFILDSTARMNAEHALRQSETKYRSLFNSMREGFALHQIICDANGKPIDYLFLDMNPAFERLTGLKKEDVIGKTVLTILPTTEPIWIEKYGHVALTGEPISFDNYTSSLKRYYQVMAFCPQINQFAVIFTDITEMKLTEEALQNAQKLDSLGVLAGGIAHDFNNLLGGIFGYLDLASEKTKEDNVSRYLAKALSVIERARGLTMQLLTFAKGGAPIKNIYNLFPFVQETAQFALSGASVSCRFDVPPDLWPCSIDKNQIGQVIDNIIINAQQSMPGGGTIDLSAQNITLAEKQHLTLPAGAYVKISIQDSGIGIPEEILPRIFDPFYTTKEKGHGLGLATCYSIINRHGGVIDVQSEPGHGSRFHIFLPATTDSASSLVEGSGTSHAGRGTILLMDDEEVMRETIGDMLQSLGYTVVTKETGQEALDFFAAERLANRQVTAMIFDLTIPGGMGGKEAVKEIRKLCPHTPVFVVSGYAEDPVMANPQDFGFTASISKPFRKSELIYMLNTHLKRQEA